MNVAIDSGKYIMAKTKIARTQFLSRVVHSWPGLPDGIFQDKNLDLGKFWKALGWKRLVCSMAVWNILRPFGILHGPL
jgi:hypothetical protein